MRVFFVGEFTIYADVEKEKQLRSWGVKDRLISYAFLRSKKLPYKDVFKKLIEEKVYDGIMVDSGAYSVATRNMKISWEEYAEFCKDFGADFYLSLDKIPYLRNSKDLTPQHFEESAKRTAENYDYMRKLGLKVIPTFHKGEPLQYLKKMVSEFSYIALSLTGQRLSSPDESMRFVNSCFEIATKISPNIKIHGLSITDLVLPIKFPWYSLDSAAWVKHAYSGTIKVIVPDHWGNGKHKYTTLAVTDRSKERNHYKYNEDFGGVVPQKYIDDIEEYLGSIGSSLEKCRVSMEERLRVNVEYYKVVLFREKEPYAERISPLL